MAYPAFHDFVALLFVYNDLLKEAANRNMRDKTMDELKGILGRLRILKNAGGRSAKICRILKRVENGSWMNQKENQK